MGLRESNSPTAALEGGEACGDFGKYMGTGREREIERERGR